MFGNYLVDKFNAGATLGLIMLAADMALQGRQNNGLRHILWPVQSRLALIAAAIFTLAIALAGVHLGLLSILLTVVALLMLVIDLAYQNQRANDRESASSLEQFHLATTVAAMLLLAVMLVSNRASGSPTLSALAFGLALGAQLVGRWQFYERLNEREL
jgi:Ca2+/Na+ antiporter